MHNLINRKKSGVTLVEVMISLLVFGIVMAVGYVFLNQTFVGLERQRQSLDTLHEARSFLMNIERDLREATAIIELDTVYRSSLFDEKNALFYKLTIEVPSRHGEGFEKVTYSYEGPEEYKDEPNADKILYRQTDRGVKRALITKQLDYLKVWGTDGTIFRNRYPEETLSAYRTYLRPHYYHPSNGAPDGLRDINKIKGIEIQLSMHEMVDAQNKPIKQRTFTTRIYPRILNAKYD